MRLAMTIFSVICLLGAAPAVSQCLPPSGTNHSDQRLIAAENDLIAAKKKDDAVFFRRTLTEDFALVGIDGQLLQGQEAADNLGDSSLVELMPYNMKVVAADDRAAIVTYDAVVRLAPAEDQGPPPRYQHFSSVWVRQGEAWKLKFHQATAAHWGDW